MSKLAEALRARKIFNNHDLLSTFGKANAVAIEYYPYEARTMRGNETVIWGITIPRRRIHGNRAKSFPIALLAAQTEFGDEYVTSPFGGYIPKYVKDAAKVSI